MPPDYTAASVPVRNDLTAAHQRAWERLRRPGTWWTGAERVAIAGAVRAAWRCALCRERKAALSPNAVAGRHDGEAALPDAAVEAVHRLTTDPGRLSEQWLAGLRAAGLSDGHYVELIGVVATVVSSDSFCRGLGVPPHPLPAPLPGEPSRYRPAQARPEGAWVPMIAAREATGAEEGLFGGGQTGNVIRALSLVPDEVRQLRDLSAAHYLTERQMIDLAAGRSLSRAQMELVAGRVSALRECFY